MPKSSLLVSGLCSGLPATVLKEGVNDTTACGVGEQFRAVFYLMLLGRHTFEADATTRRCLKEEATRCPRMASRANPKCLFGACCMLLRGVDWRCICRANRAYVVYCQLHAAVCLGGIPRQQDGCAGNRRRAAVIIMLTMQSIAAARPSLCCIGAMQCQACAASAQCNANI